MIAVSEAVREGLLASGFAPERLGDGSQRRPGAGAGPVTAAACAANSGCRG